MDIISRYIHSKGEDYFLLEAERCDVGVSYIGERYTTYILRLDDGIKRYVSDEALITGVYLPSESYLKPTLFGMKIHADYDAGDQEVDFFYSTTEDRYKLSLEECLRQSREHPMDIIHLSTIPDTSRYVRENFPRQYVCGGIVSCGDSDSTVLYSLHQPLAFIPIPREVCLYVAVDSSVNEWNVQVVIETVRLNSHTLRDNDAVLEVDIGKGYRTFIKAVEKQYREYTYYSTGLIVKKDNLLGERYGGVNG